MKSGKLIQALVATVAALICAIVFMAFNKRESSSTAVAGPTKLTKEEWYAQYHKLQTTCKDQILRKCPKGATVYSEGVFESELYKTFGKPVRTQLICNEVYWYWTCSDGVIQAILKIPGYVVQDTAGKEIVVEPGEGYLGFRFNDY